MGAPRARPSPRQPRSSPRPSEYVTGIPRALDELVESLLRERPRDRIGHAEDVRLWLGAVLEPERRRVLVPAGRPWLYRPLLSGRADAIAALAGHLAQARRGQGALVVVEGESGIGKTHVASEMARRASGDCTVVSMPNAPAGASSEAPLGSWSRLFELAVDRTVVDPDSPVAAVVTRHLALLRGLHGAFERLEATFAPPAQPPSRDEVAALLRDLVGALGAERPVLLLLDDVQWADELTLAALEAMSDAWLQGRPVLLLATCRTDESGSHVAPLLRARGAAHVALGPLAKESVRDLVADMLGVGEPPEAVVVWIARRAEGNPFVAAEYLRLLASELPIHRELDLPLVRMPPPPPGRLDALPTPGSVRELVSRRVQSLDPSCRSLAELVAVLGGAVDAGTYAALGEDLATRDALLELDRRQITEPAPGGGRRLIHDRLRVVVYGGLDEVRRRALHRDAAVLLSRVEGEPGSEPPRAALARHFLAAAMPREALPNLELAGELSLSRAAYAAASTHFATVLQTASVLTAAGEAFPQTRRVRWSYAGARASFGAGDLEACESHVREALALVGRSLPRTRAGWVLLGARETLRGVAGKLSPPRAHPPPLATVVGEAAQATGLLPYRYFFEEDLLPLVSSALLAANLARASDPSKVLPAPFSLLGAVLGLFRFSGLARTSFDRAQGAAAKAEDWREASTAHALESIYQGSFARWAEAESAGRKAAEACAHSSDPWLRENVETTLSHVEFFTGRFEDARRRAEFLAQSAIERQNIQHEVWGLFLQARSDIPCARYDAARALLERALARLAVRPEAISEIACHGMLAHVLLMQGDTDRAASLADRVNSQVRARLPPAYPSLVGYASAAAVHRAILEARPSVERRRAAREMGVALWRFAAVFPVAVPAAHLHTAHLLRLAGRRRAAHALFRRGASRASRWGMPRERGLLLLGAAATAADPGSQSQLEAEGRRILESIACTSDMF